VASSQTPVGTEICTQADGANSSKGSGLTAGQASIDSYAIKTGESGTGQAGTGGEDVATQNGGIPQGLKPQDKGADNGTAKAVLLQSTNAEAAPVQSTTVEVVPLQKFEQVLSREAEIAGQEVAETGEGQNAGPSAPVAAATFARDDKQERKLASLARDDKEEGGPAEGACSPTDEEIERLSAFIKQEPEGPAELTAREKKLAAEREKVKDQIAVLREMGELLDNPEPRFTIREGGRSHKVRAREFLMWELLKIRGKSARLQSLKVNAAQRDYAQHAAKRNIVLKARQLGITTYVAARFFLNCITRPGTLCVQVAHDQRSAEEIFRIVHRMLANLPSWLRIGALATSHANVRQIVFPHIDSSYRVETAADPSAGRGLTIQNLHCSEVSRWPGDAEETLASLRAAVTPDGEIVLESTANGAGGCFYEEWQRAAETGYSRHFYPWWWEPSYKRPVEVAEFNEEEQELIAKHGLTAEQIGFRREMKGTFRYRFAEEYAEDAESCFLTSGECMFDIGIVEERLKQPPMLTDTRENGRLLVFLPAKPDKRYIIGVDPAGGGAEGDYSVAQVIDRATGMQCAELRGHFTPEELAPRVGRLAREYNGALVAVERNNHGHAVLAVIATNHADLHVYRMGTQAGWLTSASTRPPMLENFAAVMAASPFLFASPRLLAECRTFIRRRDAGPSAANGAHDDLVMAMAIALAVRAQVTGEAASAKVEMEMATL
jgi:hypothetical protein